MSDVCLVVSARHDPLHM